jgi:SulP family sulfate permease
MRQGPKAAVQRCLPWLADVDRGTIQADAFAALAGTAVALPQAVAFSAIAGVPPEYGFYAILISSPIAALLGSSPVTLSGPTVASSALVFGTLAGAAAAGSPAYIQLAIALTFIAGCFQLLLGIGRIGRLAGFVSPSVMVGFTVVAALATVVAQLRDALGVSVERSGNLIQSAARIGSNLHAITPQPIVIAFVTFAAAALLRVVAPRAPGMLLSLVLAALVAAGLGWSRGDLQMVGELPAVIPALRWPDLSFDVMRTYGQGAFALALVGILQTVSLGRVFSAKIDRPFDSNREIVAQGISNMAGGLSQALASAGSLTRTAVASEAGARTPLAAVMSAAFMIVALAVVSPLIVHVPVPAIAGLTIYAAWRLVDMRELRHIVTTSRVETAILLVTTGAGLIVDLQFAVYVGVIVGLCIFLSKTARPALAIGAPDQGSSRRMFRNATLLNLPECPQALFVRLDGPLYFGSVDALMREFKRFEAERPGQRHLVLMLKGVGEIDLPGADLLISEARRRRARGGRFFVVALYPPLRRHLVRLGVIRAIGDENLLESKGEAVERIWAAVDRDICATCSVRIFLECRGSGPAHPLVPDAQAGGTTGSISRDGIVPP